MPNNEINGTDILVLIDPNGGTTYKNVVCLTSNTITNSVTQIDASSKCGSKFMPGSKFESSITGEGNAIDPDTGTPTNQGYAELYSLFTQKKTVSIKFGKATPTTGDYTYDGPAYISDLELVAPFDELTKFTVTFICTAPPFTQTITY